MHGPYDKHGNPVEIGDFAQLEVGGGALVYGRVVSIEQGGSTIARNLKDDPEIHPGRVKVVIEGYADFDPRNGLCGGMSLIKDPSPEAKASVQQKAKMKGLLKI